MRNEIEFSFVVESLKLQRNTENYHYLRTVQSSQIRGWPSDKEDFYSTKVAILVFYYFFFTKFALDRAAESLIDWFGLALALGFRKRWRR